MWSGTPSLEDVPGARCAVTYRGGYSDGEKYFWTAYFNGPPVPGAEAIQGVRLVPAQPPIGVYTVDPH